MRFTCSLLILLSVLPLPALEINSGVMSLQWPNSGEFQVTCNDEYLLLNPGFSVSDKAGKMVYRAPAEYEPPIATMMHPLGGDVTHGDKLEAAHKPDNTIILKGLSPGLIDLSATGKLTTEYFNLNFKTVLKPENTLRFSCKIIAPESSWLTAQTDDKAETLIKNLKLHNQNVELNIRSEAGFKLKIHHENETATITLTFSRSADFSLRFGLITK